MVVVPAPISMMAAPSSASSSASVESPAAYGLVTMASTSRWQRSIASMRLRATEISIVTTCISIPKRRAIIPRGSCTPVGIIDHVADRQGMQHGAPGPHGMAAACGEHTANVALANGAACGLDGGGKKLARGAAARDRDDDRVRAASWRCVPRGPRIAATQLPPRRDRSRRRPSSPRATVWPKPRTSTE